MKKKITELTEIRWRTTHSFDEYGNRIREREEYIAKRQVKSIGAGSRAGHFIADTILFQILIMVVKFLFAILNSFTEGDTILNLSIDLIGNVILLVLYPLLYAMCEYYFQRTPGKYLTKSLVIDEYGNKPEFRTILLRSIIRIVPFEALSCYNKFSYGWHDQWSKTWVVTEEELMEIRQLLEEQE